MRHKKYEKLIVLSHYGEINRDDIALLENHLGRCRACAEYSRKLNRVMPKVPVRQEEEVGQIVREARSELRGVLSDEKIQKAERKEYSGTRNTRRWGDYLIPAYVVAAFVLLALATGVISGYLIFGGKMGANSVRSIVSEISAKGAGTAAITGIRFLDSRDGTGNLKFSFNVVRRYEMRGPIENRDIQKILAYALVNSDNPGVRLRTIGMIDAYGKPDKEIEDALIEAVKTDDNAGVRREALVSLDKLPFDTRIREAMLFVLQHDKNPGMRVAAINFLAGKELRGSSLGADNWVDPQVLDVLKEKSISDHNRYVRLKAKDILKELKEL